MSQQWDWDNDRTVLWGDVQGRLVIQRGDLWAAGLREAVAVAGVTKIQEALDGHPDLPWLADDAREYLEDQGFHDEDSGWTLDELSDDYVAGLRESYATGSRRAVPWAHRLPSDWIPNDIIADAQTDLHMHDLDSTVTWPDDALERFERAGFRTVEAPEVLAAPVAFPSVPDV